METVSIVNPDTGMEKRWRDWQAQGVEGNRQRGAIMSRVTVIAVIGFVVWTVALLGF